MDSSSKVISIRVSMTDYVEVLQTAAKNKFTVSEFVAVKLFAEKNEILRNENLVSENLQLSESLQQNEILQLRIDELMNQAVEEKEIFEVKYKALSENLNNAVREIDFLGEDKNELNEQIRQLKERNLMAASEIQKRDKELQKRNNEITEHKNSLKTCSNEKKVLEKDLQFSKNELAKKIENIDKLTTEKNKLNSEFTAEMASNKKKISVLTQTYDEKAKKIFDKIEKEQKELRNTYINDHNKTIDILIETCSPWASFYEKDRKFFLKQKWNIEGN